MIDWIVKTECCDPGVFLINFDKDCSSFVIKRLRMIMVGIASFLASTLEKKNNGSQIQHIYCQFTLYSHRKRQKANTSVMDGSK